MRRTLLFSILVAATLVVATATEAQKRDEVALDAPLADGEALIVGFLGGRNAWNDDRRGVRRLALELRREADECDCRVVTIENRRRKLARELIVDALDRDRDGRLSNGERESARLVLYGQSFGGAAVVKLARELERMEVPVLLTVQIDSVGLGDVAIPPNVRGAANLFQRTGLLIQGERRIRAEDPSRTRILGNFEYRYGGRKIELPKELTWWDRFFARAHTKMDADPAVWGRVKAMIRRALACDGEPGE